MAADFITGPGPNWKGYRSSAPRLRPISAAAAASLGKGRVVWAERGREPSGSAKKARKLLQIYGKTRGLERPIAVLRKELSS